MISRITSPVEETLGEFIAAHYPGFQITYGSAPMDMDITHGIEVEYFDTTEHGMGIYVKLCPYVKWSDGIYKPCHYWGDRFYVTLETQ